MDDRCAFVVLTTDETAEAELVDPDPGDASFLSIGLRADSRIECGMCRRGICVRSYRYDMDGDLYILHGSYTA